jgi:hypothetical protein
MSDTAQILIILGPVVLFSAIVAFATRRTIRIQNESISINKAINNAIVDLYQEGSIIGDITDDARLINWVKESTNPSPLHQNILQYGFGGERTLTAQKFHENIYTARRLLVKFVLEGEGTETKPSDRIYSDQADAVSFVILPLLLLGSPEGSSYAANPAYSGSADYVGIADFGGFGGDGGDSGDGGGGDGGGGD